MYSKFCLFSLPPTFQNIEQESVFSVDRVTTVTEKITEKLSKDERTNFLFQKLPLSSFQERQKAANPNNWSLECLSSKKCHLFRGKCLRDT